MQKARSHPSQQPKLPRKLLPLVGTRFQVLFHSPPGVLFTFPSRYSCTIGRGRVFSLGGWSPRIQPELLDSSGLLRYPCHTNQEAYSYGTLTLCGGSFQITSASLLIHARPAPHGPYNPAPTWGTVWANPLSLAATYGISFDFSSSRYLDVSVPWVGSHLWVTEYYSRRVSPFGHPWIKGCVPLPMAFRSLPRPSSPVRA